MNTEIKTYEQGIEEGIKRAFDLLQSAAANTDDNDRSNILSDAAEDILEHAPSFKSQWLEMKEYGKRLRETLSKSYPQKVAGEVISSDPVHGWHFKPSVSWEEIGHGTKLYMFNHQCTIDPSLVLNNMLWLYRRLPRGYGSVPHIDRCINILALQTGTDIREFLGERQSSDNKD